MKYIAGYDIEFDYAFQIEVEDEYIAGRTANLGMVSDSPFKDLPIASRLKSERHPGWPSPTGYSDSDGNT